MQNTIHPVSEMDSDALQQKFRLSFTFRKWVPMLSGSLSKLVPFEEKYGTKAPAIPVPDLKDEDFFNPEHKVLFYRMKLRPNDNIFMYDDHPITHIIFSGAVQRISRINTGTYQLMYELDDGSGEICKVVYYAPGIPSEETLKEGCRVTVYGKPLKSGIVSALFIKKIDEYSLRQRAALHVLVEILSNSWASSQNVRKYTEIPVIYANTKVEKRLRMERKYDKLVGLYCTPRIFSIFKPNIMMKMERDVVKKVYNENKTIFISLIISDSYWKEKDADDEIDFVELSSDEVESEVMHVATTKRINSSQRDNLGGTQSSEDSIISLAEFQQPNGRNKRHSVTFSEKKHSSSSSPPTDSDDQGSNHLKHSFDSVEFENDRDGIVDVTMIDAKSGKIDSNLGGIRESKVRPDISSSSPVVKKRRRDNVAPLKNPTNITTNSNRAATPASNRKSFVKNSLSISEDLYEQDSYPDIKKSVNYSSKGSDPVSNKNSQIITTRTLPQSLTQYVPMSTLSWEELVIPRNYMGPLVSLKVECSGDEILPKGIRVIESKSMKANIKDYFCSFIQNIILSSPKHEMDLVAIYSLERLHIMAAEIFQKYGGMINHKKLSSAQDTLEFIDAALEISKSEGYIYNLSERSVKLFERSSIQPEVEKHLNRAFDNLKTGGRHYEAFGIRPVVLGINDVLSVKFDDIEELLSHIFETDTVHPGCVRYVIGKFLRGRDGFWRETRDEEDQIVEWYCSFHDEFGMDSDSD